MSRFENKNKFIHILDRAIGWGNGRGKHHAKARSRPLVAIVRSYVGKNEIAADQLRRSHYNATACAGQPRHDSTAARRGSAHPGGSDPPIGLARPCRLSRMWVSRQNPAPSPQGAAWPRRRRISGALEIGGRPSADRTGPFGASLAMAIQLGLGRQPTADRRAGRAGAARPATAANRVVGLVASCSARHLGDTACGSYRDERCLSRMPPGACTGGCF
jgi:hypothetical protein